MYFYKVRREAEEGEVLLFLLIKYGYISIHIGEGEKGGATVTSMLYD